MFELEKKTRANVSHIKFERIHKLHRGSFNTFYTNYLSRSNEAEFRGR